MKEKGKRFIKINASRGVLSIFLVVCILMGAFCFQYYRQLQSTIQTESSGYLHEISRRIGSNVDQILKDNFVVLNTVSSVLKSSGADSFADIKQITRSQQEQLNYSEIILIDDGGTAYNDSGKQVVLNNNTYFENVITNQKRAISTTQMIDNKECIMLTTPVEKMVVDGINIVAVAASYDPNTFNETLSMSSFSGQAFSCIIGKSGSVIVRSSADSSFKSGYNVLTTIGESKMDAGYSIDKVKKDIQQDVAGQIIFEDNTERFYMVYTPISADDWFLLTFVPVKAVNEKSDMLLRITLLICGLITMIFAALIAFILYSFNRNKRKLEHLAYVDEVTGGNTIQRFYELAEDILDTPNSSQYVIVYTNLAKFKVLNEQFGRNVCNSILQSFYRNIAESLNSNECVGRISADNFCILMEYKDENTLLKRFETWYTQAENYVILNKPAWSLPVTEFGVYIIENNTLPFPQMIDRAKLALREFPRHINNKLHYAIFDDTARSRLFREKYLEDMMEEALIQNEFQVYLQPKYCVSDKKMNGAEALARWVSPSEGMIFPDEFIPLFEKNGFIVQLDLWVFEEVCRLLRTWIDKGAEPIKISVNCSRVHLKNEGFLKSYYNIAHKYNVPPKLIEIELTESIVMEDFEHLSHVIDDIHSMGFGCSMDDFGSGYSSLNLIQSIQVDTLKLDKIFFRGENKNSDRMESVVSSIVTMSKALNMNTVAEGVEYPEQVAMLEKVGCDSIQGFVFSKPIPVIDFEKLMFETNENEE